MGKYKNKASIIGWGEGVPICYVARYEKRGPICYCVECCDKNERKERKNKK
jgi:hypothetical protein